MFQSRNRESFLFKFPFAFWFWRLDLLFQSRNRESFLFKEMPVCLTERSRAGFNLVIESLFFSSRQLSHPSPHYLLFQSRNRESFLFKYR